MPWLGVLASGGAGREGELEREELNVSECVHRGAGHLMLTSLPEVSCLVCGRGLGADTRHEEDDQSRW